jgi:hypothetical protein
MSETQLRTLRRGKIALATDILMRCRGASDIMRAVRFAHHPWLCAAWQIAFN